MDLGNGEARRHCVQTFNQCWPAQLSNTSNLHTIPSALWLQQRRSREKLLGMGCTIQRHWCSHCAAHQVDALLMLCLVASAFLRSLMCHKKSMRRSKNARSYFSMLQKPCWLCAALRHLTSDSSCRPPVGVDVVFIHLSAALCRCNIQSTAYKQVRTYRLLRLLHSVHFVMLAAARSIPARSYGPHMTPHTSMRP